MEVEQVSDGVMVTRNREAISSILIRTGGGGPGSKGENVRNVVMQFYREVASRPVMKIPDWILRKREARPLVKTDIKFIIKEAGYTVCYLAWLVTVGLFKTVAYELRIALRRK